MVSFICGFTLRVSAFIPSTKLLYHQAKERDPPSKMMLLRWVHKDHIAMVMTSLKMTEPKFSLARNIIVWKSEEVSKWIFRKIQQALEKGQSKNKCLISSSVSSTHNTQQYESRCIFFLLSMDLVLSLSLKRSQKKNLCVCWALEIQIHLYRIDAGRVSRKLWYALQLWKIVDPQI